MNLNTLVRLTCDFPRYLITSDGRGFRVNYSIPAQRCEVSGLVDVVTSRFPP
ncbi:hypothetical protein [Alloactinosynnema sp. L-07]|nr:hypothetical protein [Alloactinosynnema sp. L-07]